MVTGSETHDIEVRGLVKEYRGEGGTVKVLDALDLSVAAGSLVSVEGASGVGKSTLLNILGTLDRASSGNVRIAGREVTSFSENETEFFRAHTLGFIFQHVHLLPDFTIEENVMMPLLIQRRPTGQGQKEAREKLALVGLDHRLSHFPSQISGGELARAGVARALVGNKKILLADEPTGNLDRKNSNHLADLLWELQVRLGFTLVIVTHDQELAGRVPVRYSLENGRLVRK